VRASTYPESAFALATQVSLRKSFSWAAAGN